MFTPTRPRTPPKQSKTRFDWPQLALLGSVLGLGTLGAVLEFLHQGITVIAVTLLCVVAFNLTALVASKRRRRWLMSLAPYLYIALLLVAWLYALYFIYPSSRAQHLILTALLLLPTLYAHLFNRFAGPQALLQGGAVLSSFVLLSVPHALTTFGGVGLFDGLFFTVVFGVSQALLLSFVATLSWSGGELSQVRRDAAWFQRLANHDSLTGLPNRRQIEQVLGTTIAQSERNSVPFAVLMIDIDHFKRLNDTFGHPLGDEVLRQVATRLREQLRAGNTLGRWGGEEFMVIAPYSELQEARKIGERLRHAVRSEPVADEHMLTVSVGVAVYRSGDTPETLVDRADQALYRAKQAGRDRLEV